ncbi:MAG: hypothetical protein QOK37_128 [Thermoanaerobaculia bacterium]|jgi:hypothetical protein|nr:hypothetical protein [Thermoanaerobaculia bacterium]
MLRGLLCTLAFVSCIPLAAQERLIGDPDDSVDPGQRDGALFISSLVAGGVANFIADYRPVHRSAAFVLFTNSLYWSRFQFDYKRSQISAGGDAPVYLCRCPNPIYFPTPPPPGSTPAAPTPGSKDTIQAAWYGPSLFSGPPEDPPLLLRYRLTISRQPIETVIRDFATGEVLSQMSGRERSVGLDVDTYFPIGKHEIYGSLLFARTIQTGTPANRSQTEFAYMGRFPGIIFRNILMRATLTVGGVSNRGGTALNVVNPAFEAFWHDPTTRANFHLVWSPQSTNSGTGGWETHHQIALFVDRALYVHLFRAHTDKAKE